MAQDNPFILRWGIVSTGHIAAAFTKDLLIDPKTRDVHDVEHKVTSVGSRSVEKAHEFIDRIAGGDQSIKAFGTYQEVYTDKDVDAIYIGTPHTYHYVNALDAINSGKHVLCEKPVTCNSAELRSLIAAAREKVKRIAEEGTLGLPVLLHADLSIDFDIYNMPLTHRILDPALGGGALLDIGPYPLFWAILALFENPANNSTAPTNISSAMLNTPLTPVDSSTVFNLTFSGSKLAAQAALSCSITLNPIDPGVTIRFERGTIMISAPIYCPKEFKVQYLGEDRKIKREERRIFEYVGGGLHFEADEVARCVRDGKKESALWGHEKSLLEMSIFDQVRRQGGYVFPPGVEKVLE